MSIVCLKSFASHRLDGWMLTLYEWIKILNQNKKKFSLYHVVYDRLKFISLKFPGVREWRVVCVCVCVSLATFRKEILDNNRKSNIYIVWALLFKFCQIITPFHFEITTATLASKPPTQYTPSGALTGWHTLCSAHTVHTKWCPYEVTHTVFSPHSTHQVVPLRGDTHCVQPTQYTPSGALTRWHTLCSDQTVHTKCCVDGVTHIVFSLGWSPRIHV